MRMTGCISYMRIDNKLFSLLFGHFSRYNICLAQQDNNTQLKFTKVEGLKRKVPLKQSSH